MLPAATAISRRPLRRVVDEGHRVTWVLDCLEKERGRSSWLDSELQGISSILLSCRDSSLFQASGRLNVLGLREVFLDSSGLGECKLIHCWALGSPFRGLALRSGYGCCQWGEVLSLFTTGEPARGYKNL